MLYVKHSSNGSERTMPAHCRSTTRQQPVIVSVSRRATDDVTVWGRGLYDDVTVGGQDLSGDVTVWGGASEAPSIGAPIDWSQLADAARSSAIDDSWTTQERPVARIIPTRREREGRRDGRQR